jgi:DNA-binding HxlR family transcriptional regulator
MAGSGEQQPTGMPAGACDAPDQVGKMLRQVVDRIGDKWSVLIIGMLQDQPLRFSELQRRVGGISQRMLTLSLRQLERDGLVTRTVFAEVPARVVYELTPLGRTLIPKVLGLLAWASEHNEEIEANRSAFDRSKNGP